jgi:hypothetical protein
MIDAGAPCRDGVVWNDELAVALDGAALDPLLTLAAGRTLLLAIERDDLADALRDRGWQLERAILHTLPDASHLPDDEGASLVPPGTDLSHVPAPLAAELARAQDLFAAWVDGVPVSFAHAPWRTPRWFDVAVDTLPAARQLGLATRVAAAMIRHGRAGGREPVWGASELNQPSLRLATRLGFVPVDALWIASPP